MNKKRERQNDPNGFLMSVPEFCDAFKVRQSQLAEMFGKTRQLVYEYSGKGRKIRVNLVTQNIQFVVPEKVYAEFEIDKFPDDIRQRIILQEGVDDE